MDTHLKVLRADEEVDAPGMVLTIPLGWEFEETKNAAWKLVFPGNGDSAPWECKLLTIENVEIDDMSLMSVVPQGIILVHPGEDFVDQGGKAKEGKMRTLSKLIRRNKDKKEDKKEDDKEEKKEEKKEEEKKEPEDKKERKDFKRLSFFGSVRKTKGVDLNERDAHLPDWLRLQKRIFTRYVNQKFRDSNSKTRVDDLAQECKDAMILVELVEIMSGKTYPDKKMKAQKVRIKQIDNCAAFLAFAKGECGIVTDCSAENIVDGDEKALLSLLYHIIIKYMKLDEEDEDSAGMDVKQTLVLWLRNKLQGYEIVIDEKNICKAFQDGMAFCALLHKMRPKLIPYTELFKEQKIKNLTLSLDIAEQYAGVQQYVEPSDISKLDELGMIVYLSDWYHGVAFMELQNSGARRIGKLVRMTKLHDKMKAEYDERALNLSKWIEAKIKQLDDHTFDNTLEGIKAKQTEFYSYKKAEKAEKISEQLDMEALFDDLSLRLSNNNRPAYVAPTGLSVPEIRTKFQNLEKSENARSEAMQKELARQNKLQKLVARFNEDTQKSTEWTQKKEEYLKATEAVDSIASAQKHLNVLDAFNKEWNSRKGTQIHALQELTNEIVNDNYKDKAAISSKSADVVAKFEALPALSETKKGVLEKSLELEKKKEQLRLEFASAAKDFELYTHDQIEIVSNRYFGVSLEEVKATDATLQQSEQEIKKGLAEKKTTYDSLWAELQQHKVTNNDYTTLTPQELTTFQSNVEQALTSRRTDYAAELARQEKNDQLCRDYASKIQSFFDWVSKKKAAASDKSQELESKFELVKNELANSQAEADAKVAELEGLDSKIQEAEITHNHHSKATTPEAKIAYQQYRSFLEKLVLMLEAEQQNKANKGVTPEQRQEILDNFKYFDKNSNGTLDKAEFRACLQSLGQRAAPQDVKDAFALYGKETTDKITLEEFTDFMMKRIGDTDTQEEIIDAFQTINQNEIADDDHMTAVVNDTTFPPQHFDYLKKEMPAQDGGYNYTTWTEAVFNR